MGQVMGAGAGAEVGRENSYQWLLRALGAYLDEGPSCRITLAEVPDGFVVRLQRALHKLEPQVLHFKRETLRHELEQLMSERKSSPAGIRARHQGIWSQFPNGHQDFFRALGYELDQMTARHILVDELEDGIVVSYLYQKSDGGQWGKTSRILTLEDIEKILNDAFERRKKAQKPPQGGGTGEQQAQRPAPQGPGPRRPTVPRRPF